MDDPVYGRFTKAEYRAYFEGQGEERAEFSEIVTEEIGGLEAQWGWYKQASGEGAFLNKAGPEGVHSTSTASLKNRPATVSGTSPTRRERAVVASAGNTSVNLQG